MKNKIVTKEEWLSARKKLLQKEKEFTRQRDALSKERQEMPWVKVEKTYTFDGPNGKETLADLFDGKSQLVVYQFMFGPDWEEGCPSCSFWADNFASIPIHLAHRDVSLVAISRAPLEKLNAYKKRMGWNFKWVSSMNTDYNFDFQATLKKDGDSVYYNYKKTTFPAEEAPGISVFFKKGKDIFHTYSTYERGLDMLNGAYHYLDLVPKGRDEASLPFTMSWLRRRDQYEKN